MTDSEFLVVLAVAVFVLGCYAVTTGTLSLRVGLLKWRIARRSGQLAKAQCDTAGFNQLKAHSTRLIRELGFPLKG